MTKSGLAKADHRLKAARRGITMLEVLVVVGIIGTLLAITIPGVQYARESARRTQCQNNQRQILQACHAFEATGGSLPSHYNGTSLAYPLQEWDLFHMHSWRVELLPYLEQQPLRDALTRSSYATDPVNRSVAQSVGSLGCLRLHLRCCGWDRRILCGSKPRLVRPLHRCVTRSSWTANR